MLKICNKIKYYSSVLIVKKNAKVQIKKNIRHIFRKHNIFEYKTAGELSERR